MVSRMVARGIATLCLVTIELLILGSVFPALAQEAGAEQAKDERANSTTEGTQQTKSGYEDVPQFGGPGSVGTQIEKDDQVKTPVYRFDTLQRLLKPYYEFKARLHKERGFSFGLDYTALYEAVSESRGEDQAASGIFRFFSTWTLLGRETPNTGNLVFKVENRHRLGTEIAPFALGIEAGSILPTAVFFTDFGWGVTNLYWQQRFRDGKATLLFGRVDVTDYFDVYALAFPLAYFTNFAFLYPTASPPNQGQGAALGARITDQLYGIAGFADANGDPTRVGFDTFFEDAEFFTHIELGWSPSFERRYLDNVHVTAWHADEREKAGVPDGWGLLFSAQRFLKERWLPFLRAGYSEGEAPALNASVSAGLGYYVRQRADVTALGVSWGQPSLGGLNDQYTLEYFYRLQFSQNFALTPDVQLIVNPALNPNEDLIAVFGIRGRLTL